MLNRIAPIEVDTHTLAYLAGVVDSDGWISVLKQTYLMEAGAIRNPMYVARVGIGQVEPQAVELAQAIFGGHVSSEAHAGRRPMLRWTVGATKARIALVSLKPYLRIKIEQANNALSLYSFIGGSSRRWEVKRIEPDDALIPIGEFAFRAGVSRASVSQAVRKKSVPFAREGKNVYLPEWFVTEYATRRELGRGSPARPQRISDELERIYQRAKALNAPKAS